MQRLRHSRPSPGVVVAILALVAALAGTAVAQEATTSALTKKKVKKIVDKRINKLAPGLSVANADNATNAQNAENAENAQNAENATNAQNATNAEDAAHADNATTANNANAVDGVSAAGIRYRRNSENNATQILNLGGLQLVANCNGGVLSLTADTSANNSQLLSSSMDAANENVENGVADEDYDTAEPVVNLFPDDNHNELLHIEYTRPAGANPLLSPSSATSVTLQADNTAAADAPDCVVTGHALQNGGGGIIIGPIGP